MLRRIPLVLLLVSLAAGLVVAAPSRARPAQPPTFQKSPLSDVAPMVVPDEVVVSFRRPTDPRRAQRILSRAGFRALSLGRRTGVVKVPAGSSAARTARSVAGLPEVASAEPNLLRVPMAFPRPDDPLFSEQWSLENTGQPHGTSTSASAGATGTPDADIDALEAWEVETGRADAVIAVVDSGVDVTHPDLQDSLWTNPGESGIDDQGRDKATNLEDDDGNGFVDDVHGWDFAENDNTLLEPDQSVFGAEHGTHVAGTIAAGFNDATGVAGVCPGCKIMVLKIGEPVDSEDPDRVPDFMGLDLASEIQALDYAQRMGAQIVNGSFGAPIIWSLAEYKALKRLGAGGVLAVLASGNLNGDNDMFLLEDLNGDDQPDTISPTFPAAYDLPGILSVAASNHKDQYGIVTGCTGGGVLPCTFTNWGRRSVDVAAPGVDVISAVPGGNHAIFDGTSMAAPHVAGLAGLLVSQRPGLGPEPLKHHILNTVDKPDTLRSLRAFSLSSPVRGSFSATNGRVNADRAVRTVPDLTAADKRHDGTITGAKRIRRSISGRVAWPGDVNDVYRKRLVAGKSYRVVLDGPSGRDLDLWVWKPGTKEILQIEEGCVTNFGRCKLLGMSATPTADEKACFSVRKTGTHYLQVVSFVLSRGDYDIKVRPVSRCRR